MIKKPPGQRCARRRERATRGGDVRCQSEQGVDDPLLEPPGVFVGDWPQISEVQEGY